MRFLAESEILPIKDSFVPVSIENRLIELNFRNLDQNFGSDSKNVGRQTEWIKSTVTIVGYSPKYNILSFRIRSVSRPKLEHVGYVQFIKMPQAKKSVQGKTFEDSSELRDLIIDVIKGDIKVHCNCESHQYYRSYQLTQMRAAIFPEQRPPVINDPQLKRTHMCHHLFAVMKYLKQFEEHLVVYLTINEKDFAHAVRNKEIQAMKKEQLITVVKKWTDLVGKQTQDKNLQRQMRQRIFQYLKDIKLFTPELNKFGI